MTPRPPTAIAAGASVVLAALLLGGCSMLGLDGGEAAPVPTATVTVTAVPEDPGTPTSSARLPGQCSEVASEAVLASTFGSVPLNDPAVIPPENANVVAPKPRPANGTPEEIIGAATWMRCVWGYLNADQKVFRLSISSVLAADATAYLDTLPDEGFTCQEDLGGTRCSRLEAVGSPPVEQGETRFFRDGVFVTVSQSNFPTSGFLAGVVERMWG